MAALTQQTNADGLVVRHGFENVVSRPGESKQAEREFVLDFAYSDITAAAGTGFFDMDSGGGSTPDMFSDAVPFIPEGSLITAAYLVAVTPWTGTATIDIGFWDKGSFVFGAGTASAVLNVDALYDGTDVDSTTAGLGDNGNVLIPNGVQAMNTSGTYDPDAGTGGIYTDGDLYVRVVNADAGTLTAGTAKLIVKYINYQS